MRRDLFILERYPVLFVLYRNYFLFKNRLIIAIWPAFGFYSPFLIFAMFLGFLNVSHFLPNNHFGIYTIYMYKDLWLLV